MRTAPNVPDVSCAYCGAEDSLGRDHVVPRRRGGPDHPRNIVIACATCNSRKSDRLPSEWLDDVPPHVAAIERSVCDSIGASLGGRERTAPGEIVATVTLPAGALTVAIPVPELVSQRTSEAALSIPHRVYLESLPTYRAAGGEVMSLGKLRIVRRAEFVAWLSQQSAGRGVADGAAGDGGGSR